MHTFDIKEDFLLDGKPMKIISGAIHYFRMTPSQWEDSLYNLKALGANTVETYIPWNIHEPIEGKFDFSGRKDVVAFVNLAQKMGLYVILRPSVYICAEWEFGGLPAWLLKNGMIRLRSTDPYFMEKTENYYHELLPKLRPLQVTQGGPVIMMQIENEYGSYGMEKDYLLATKKMVESYGIEVPLFTSDGSWKEVLDSGSLIDEDVFVAGNFGSKSIENSTVLKNFMEEHHKNWPIMSMEYWDGWFNRWGDDIIKRDPQDLADEVEDMLKIGSINLYMFHGGTNFGFYNGCSARGRTDLPQVTSYDYDALLNESGQPTEKYYLVQQAIKNSCPDVWQAEPRLKTLINLGTFPIQKSVSFFHTKDDMMTPVFSSYPLTMEQVGTGYGYLLYDFDLKNYHHENKFKVVEASDRLHLFADGEHLATQYHDTNGEEIMVQGNQERNTIEMSVLVENLGRVNYGYKLNNPTQMKGIRGGVMYDIHFHQGFKHYPLSLSKEELERINFDKESDANHPSFYQASFDLDDIGDTYIDCSNYGKGVVIVNGHNLGRYWNRGPYLSLYCPKDFLNEGKNDIIIFETEGKDIKEITFSDKPIYL